MRVGSKKIGLGFASVGIAVLALAAGLPGCTQTQRAADGTPVLAPQSDQKTFPTSDAAALALVSAAEAGDQDKINEILGPAGKDLMSGDPVEDSNGLKSFASHAAECAVVQDTDDHTSILYLGKSEWPFPIPIAKSADGKWFFNTIAGKDEILARRIGRNELDAIQVLHACMTAQREYAQQDRDGSGVLKYAQRFTSTTGHQDGLYWDNTTGQDGSPLGPMMAQAAMEGYPKHEPHTPRQPYHGYFYRILKKQGPAAPGGEYNYVINGNMIGGYALIAWPDKYGNSGRMTFIVNHQGKIFQRDLGPTTANAVADIRSYNPDMTWTEVKE